MLAMIFSLWALMLVEPLLVTMSTSMPRRAVWASSFHLVSNLAAGEAMIATSLMCCLMLVVGVDN